MLLNMMLFQKLPLTHSLIPRLLLFYSHNNYYCSSGGGGLMNANPCLMPVLLFRLLAKLINNSAAIMCRLLWWFENLPWSQSVILSVPGGGVFKKDLIRKWNLNPRQSHWTETAGQSRIHLAAAPPRAGGAKWKCCCCCSSLTHKLNLNSAYESQHVH